MHDKRAGQETENSAWEGRIQRPPTFYESAVRAEGKVYGVRKDERADGRKEGRKRQGPSPRARWEATSRTARFEERGGGRGGVFCLSDIKEPVANFLPSLPARPSCLPGSYAASCSIRPHTRVHTTRSRPEFRSSGR